MNLREAIKGTQTRIEEDGPLCVGLPEEQTKTTLILPMLHEVFGIPHGVRFLRAEYGDDGREKVDYAVQSGNIVTLLIECKPIGTIDNPLPHMDQLAKYFGMGGCKLICLTDGCIAYFAMDLVRDGILDDEPCYKLDMRSLSEGDYSLLTQLRLHILDREALYDVVSAFSYQEVLRKRMLAMSANLFHGIGIDVSSADRGDAWQAALSQICRPAEENENPKAYVPRQTTEIRPIPAEHDLGQGRIYRIYWETPTRKAPYDGFIWFPHGNAQKGPCYILPGSRIRVTEHPVFKASDHQKTVISHRDFIMARDAGLVACMMKIEAPSSASRIISGTDVSFGKVAKSIISVADYYELVPEAYDPQSRPSYLYRG